MVAWPSNPMALLQWIFTSILQIRPDSILLSLPLPSSSCNHSNRFLSIIHISDKQSRILLLPVCPSPCGSTTAPLPLWPLIFVPSRS